VWRRRGRVHSSRSGTSARPDNSSTPAREPTRKAHIRCGARSRKIDTASTRFNRPAGTAQHDPIAGVDWPWYPSLESGVLMHHRKQQPVAAACEATARPPLPAETPDGGPRAAHTARPNSFPEFS
jgi:hypothetical protein